MEYRLQRFDQHQQNPFSSSSTSYNIYSSQVPEMLHRPMDITESINWELEKERIRSEIIAWEIERRRVLEAEVRREMYIECREFQPMYGELYVPDNRIVVMSSFPAGRYGGFEAVSYQRRPQSPKFKEIVDWTHLEMEKRKSRSSPKSKEIVDWEPPRNGKKEIIGLGNPFVSRGSKRKRSPSPAGSGSTRHCSNSSKKKIREEFSCAACEVSSTCEHGLNEHIAGKKHQAKMEEMKAKKKGAQVGLGKVMNTVNKQPLEIKNFSDSDSVLIISKGGNKTEGCDKKVMAGKKFKFWCRLCKIGADDENIMRSHKKGKKHLKNLRKKKREKTKRARSKSN